MSKNEKVRRSANTQELLQTFILVLGFLVGGGFLFDLIKDMGRVEVKVEHLEKSVGQLQAGGAAVASEDSGKDVFDEASFQQEMLAEVQYLVGKVSEVQVPGFAKLDQDAKEDVVKCMMFKLAAWKVSQRCLSAKQDFLDFVCIDETTNTVVKLPVEVKALAASCSMG